MEASVQRNSWERFLRNTPEALPFHENAWLDAASEHTRSSMYRMVFESETGMRGGCPLFLVRRNGFRLLASPAPRSAAPYLGPTWRGLEVLDESTRLNTIESFLTELEGLMKSVRATLTVLKLSPNLWDVRPFLWHGFMCRVNYTYRLNLERDEADIFHGFGNKLRRTIKKAERSIAVEIGSSDDVSALFASVADRFKEKDATTVLSQDYLTKVHQTMAPDRAELLLAKRGDEIVNATLDLTSSQARYGWIGSVRPNDAAEGAPQLLIWRSIQRAHATRKKWFELFGGATEGLWNFKAQYNPDILPYYEVSKGRGIGRIFAHLRSPR